MVNSGRLKPDANIRVNSGRAAQADEKIDPAAPEIAQSGQEEFAERVGQHAQGRDGTHANDGIGMTDAMLPQFLDQQRGCHRQIGAAEVQCAVATKQQEDDDGLTCPQRPHSLAANRYSRAGRA